MSSVLQVPICMESYALVNIALLVDQEVSGSFECVFVNVFEKVVKIFLCIIKSRK